MPSSTKSVWLGLGGNIGDVTQNMAQALQGLDAHDDIAVTQVSSVFKTPPWGVEDQPWFLNCCAEVETSLSPEELLEECQAAERAGKRERIVRWGPRTIDVDILVFEGVEQIEQRLTIPHPRMLERAFVLIPLAEIAADMELQGQTVAQRSAAFADEQIERIPEAGDWWKQ